MNRYSILHTCRRLKPLCLHSQVISSRRTGKCWSFYKSVWHCSLIWLRWWVDKNLCCQPTPGTCSEPTHLRHLEENIYSHKPLLRVRVKRLTNKSFGSFSISQFWPPSTSHHGLRQRGPSHKHDTIGKLKSPKIWLYIWFVVYIYIYINTRRRFFLLNRTLHASRTVSWT